MRIEYLGHSCVRLTLRDGRVVVFDPYEPLGLGGRLRYQPVPTRADLVFISHEHRDHADSSWLTGPFGEHRGDFVDDGLQVVAEEAYHDEHRGLLRGGRTRLFVVEADGVRLVHCGDLGERLGTERVAGWGTVDVLVTPTGGYFTLGPAAATELVRRVAPRWFVPCHYGTTATVDMELETVDPVLRRHSGPISRRDALEAVARKNDETTAHRESECVVLRPLGLLTA